MTRSSTRFTAFVAAFALLSLASSSAHAAGFVQAKLKKGDLILKGDSERNVIELESLGNAVRITGYEGTLINGFAQVIVDVSDDIKIKMGDGNDDVYVTGITVDDLIVNMSDGDDYVDIYACHILSDLKISTGDDNDQVYVGYTQIDDDLSAKLGDDDDYFQTVGMTTLDDAKVTSSDGYDYTYIHSSYFGDKSDVDMGDDDDRLDVVSGTVFTDDAELDGGDDKDQLYLFTATHDDVDVDDFEVIFD